MLRAIIGGLLLMATIACATDPLVATPAPTANPPTEIPTALPMETPQPESKAPSTVVPTLTNTPEPTATRTSTATLVPTATPLPAFTPTITYSTPTPVPTATSAPKPTATLVLTVTPTPTMTPTSTPRPTPVPSKTSGLGDAVVNCTLGNADNVFEISHNGTSNFAVHIYDSKDGSDLLVNEIGQYSGTVLARSGGGVFGLAPGPCTLEVNADGAWTIVTATPASGKTKGSGDSVVSCDLAKGNNVFEISHNGTSNFAVHIYDSKDGSDLLVNEIGQYSGTVLARSGGGVFGLAPGPCTIAITADGSWTMKIAR